MLGDLGFFSLWIAFLCAAYAALMAGLSAWRRNPVWLASARRAALLTTPLLTLSALALTVLLVNNVFEHDYVASVTSYSMPVYLKITALWGGQAGSLLFWSWLMSAFTASALLGKWQRDRDLMPVVMVVMMVTLGFFIGLVLFLENPFNRMWRLPSGEFLFSMWQPVSNAVQFIPVDGNGLNPLLRHPGMIIHPPMLYLGFVGFVVPYAFAMAALVTRRVDDEWIRTTRRWTLIGWLFLSLGLILGGRWAYDVLGWGGYWGWDPVENAALMPWLTGTAFLHSVMIQEKRGMLKKWNMVLIILTYLLVIFGTFLTRSGVLSSVHSFAQSAIGPTFFVFIVVMTLVSLGLLFRSWDALASEHQLEGLFSREAAFLLNNLLFMGITVTVFVGTVMPVITEALTGQIISVGAPFYNQVVGPQLGALVLLMGLGPLMAWRQAAQGQVLKFIRVPGVVALVSMAGLAALGLLNPLALLGIGACVFTLMVTLAEFWRGTQARMKAQQETAWAALTTLMARNRRRYGGYIIHIGVVVMTIGVIGSSMFQLETQGRIAEGQSLNLGGYTMLYERLDEFVHTDGRQVSRATVSVWRDGQKLAELYPRRDFYPEQQQPMTIPGARSSFEDDFYVLLIDWEPIGQHAATFKLYVNPLINWVWAGGLIFILGTLVAAWPDMADDRRRRTVLSGPRPANAPAAGD